MKLKNIFKSIQVLLRPYCKTKSGLKTCKIRRFKTPHHKSVSEDVPFKGTDVNLPAGSYAVTWRNQDGWQTKYFKLERRSIINLKELFFRQV